MVAGRSRALNRAHGVGVGNDVKWSLGGPYPGPLRTRQAARFIRRDVQRDTPDAETANWRAVCEKTARTVRRAGRRKPSRPLSKARPASIDHRLRRLRGALQEVKVAAFIGLRHMLLVEPDIAALIDALRRRPGGFAAGELLARHVEMQLARLDVDLDHVAILHQGERAADRGFGRDMQHAGAEMGAAHAR